MASFEEEFDKLVTYTLRVELKSGKVIVYIVDTENKDYLLGRLRRNSDGDVNNQRIEFLWFETSANRMVLINSDFITRVTFCFDYSETLVNPNVYYDNFNLLQKETLLEEQENAEGEVRLHVVEEHYLPQAVILHDGNAPDDHYDGNPLTYSALDPGCLYGLPLELDSGIPLRQFLNLTDNDGEESFIPMKQIIIMEFDSNLVEITDAEDGGGDDDVPEIE